jgi:hypothetical protein
MRWYYVNETHERMGIEENDLPVLVGAGLVRSHTLLWQPGRADWVAAGELMPELFSAAGRGMAPGAETPIARLALQPLLRWRGWLALLAAAVLAKAVLEVPPAFRQIGSDNAAAAGILLRILVLVALGALITHWLVTLQRASRSGSLDDLRSSARAGGRLILIAGIAGLVYLLSVLYALIRLAAVQVAGP